VKRIFSHTSAANMTNNTESCLTSSCNFDVCLWTQGPPIQSLDPNKNVARLHLEVLGFQSGGDPGYQIRPERVGFNPPAVISTVKRRFIFLARELRLRIPSIMLYLLIYLLALCPCPD